MNRIDRISAILIQLQSRRVVRAADIADRFGISLRTVYRDIRTLEEAGIPLIGEAGIGYSLAEGYRLPPIMFTRQEATAFLTAEKFIEKLTDVSTPKHHKSAMYKIRAILKSAEKNLLEDIDTSIEVLKSHSQLRADNQNHIQNVLEAIGQKRVLAITYFALHNQQETQRQVEPVGIYYLDSYWHLIAFCRLRNDYRNFRLDRIRAIALTEDVFVGGHPTLKDYIARTAKEHEVQQVVIRVDKPISYYIDYQKYYHGFVSEREIDNKVEMIFLTNHIEGFARWFLMFADKASISSPETVKTRVNELVALIAKRLG